MAKGRTTRTTTPTLEPSTSSYLYLHPGENPVASLVSPVLDSTNYHSWSRSIVTTLSAKNKVEFVLGTHPCPPTNDSTYSAWIRCNNMVVSWLVHSVSLPIRQSIIWMDVAVDIWNDLKTRYSQGDLSRISDLQSEASSLSQNDLSVTDYFTKLRVIWDELDNFRPNHVCVCQVKCTCSVASDISKRKREDQAMQFLRGLNDQFNNIRSHVLLMEPVPPISKKISLVAQQERQLASNFLIPNINHASASRNSTPTCSFCGKFGHTEKICFKKVGFPNQENKNFRFNSNRKICTHCGKNGHTIDTCYRKHGFPSGYNPPNSRTTPLLNANVTDDVSSEICQQEQINGDMPSVFRAQQYQVLSALIKQNSINNIANQPPVQLNQVGSFAVNKDQKDSSTGQFNEREDWYS
ncbi:uncharacterized protein [Phaseolus vulgaris]|uniref:uncharacterized protein n=1 Tax=Phaseolus vulgaris TaxID=3885 RepID=UPI0035CBB804